MSAEIVSIRGDIPTWDTRKTDIVEILREALEQAERGEIDAFVMSIHRPSQKYVHWWSGPRVLMLGLASSLVHDLAATRINEG